MIRPQSGIYIAEMGASALDGLISNILTMDPQTVWDFIETRSHLEILSAGLAAERASKENLENIRIAHRNFINAFKKGEKTLETDHLFHLAIVKSSGNRVLQSLISLLTPDIIALNRNFVEKDQVNYRNTPEEHQKIVDSIESGKPDAASAAMSRHMDASRIRRMGKQWRN